MVFLDTCSQGHPVSSSQPQEKSSSGSWGSDLGQLGGCQCLLAAETIPQDLTFLPLALSPTPDSLLGIAASKLYHQAMCFYVLWADTENHRTPFPALVSTKLGLDPSTE